MSTPNSVDRLVELRQEARSVLGCHRCRTTGQRSPLPESVLQIAHGQRSTELIVREWMPFRIEDESCFCQAAGRKRNIGGNNYVTRPNVLGDPIVGRAETRPYNQFHQRGGWYPQWSIDHDDDAHRVTAGNALFTGQASPST
jgi:hypothetical protein